MLGLELVLAAVAFIYNLATLGFGLLWLILVGLLRLYAIIANDLGVKPGAKALVLDGSLLWLLALAESLVGLRGAGCL